VFRTNEVIGLPMCVDHTWGWVVYKDRMIVAAGSDVCSCTCAIAAEKEGLKHGLVVPEVKGLKEDEVVARIPPRTCTVCGGLVERLVLPDGECVYVCTCQDHK